MTDGTKKVLVVGGVVVVGYFGWKFLTSKPANLDTRAPSGATNVRVVTGNINGQNVTQVSYQPPSAPGTADQDVVASYRRS